MRSSPRPEVAIPSVENRTPSRWRVGVSGQYSAGDFLVQAGVFSDNIDALPGKSWSTDGRIVYLPKSP